MTRSGFSWNHDTLIPFSVYPPDTAPARVLLAPQTAVSRSQETVDILPLHSAASDRSGQRLLKKNT